MTIYRLYDELGEEIGIFKSKVPLDFDALIESHRNDPDTHKGTWGLVDALVADGHLTLLEVNDVWFTSSGLRTE